MEDNSKIVGDLGNLISEIYEFISDKEYYQFIDRNKSAEFQYLLSKLVAFIDKISGVDKYYYKEAFTIIQSSKRNGGYYVMNIQQLVGHLKFLKDGLENNWLARIRNEISGNEMINFLNYAQNFIKDGKKIESSIIATALFEDSIRKIGKNCMIEHKDLEQIINRLKKENIISKTDSKKWKYYAGLRNSALHANWSEFGIDDVEKLITDLIEIIDEFLKNTTQSSIRLLPPPNRKISK